MAALILCAATGLITICGHGLIQHVGLVAAKPTGLLAYGEGVVHTLTLPLGNLAG